MKRKLVLFALMTAGAMSAWASFDQTIVAIFGGGNPNSGWTTATGGGITLGLRGKDRLTTGPASTANNGGLYGPYATGFEQPNNNRATWQWEFSINSGPVNLATYDYYVGIDTDRSACINYTVVDAMTYWTDNSYGNNGTANGQGVEGTSGAPNDYATIYNIAQQSQNLVFIGGIATVPGTYSYELYAVEKGDGPAGVRIASVGITVVVGAGGQACNVPADKNQCKNGGWSSLTRIDASPFKNQGDCIQYVNTGH
jgi:hypothetical protein